MLERESEIRQKIKEYEAKAEALRLSGRDAVAYVFYRLKRDFGLDEGKIARLTGYSPVTVADYLRRMKVPTASEAEIEEFMVKNWRKTGLFEYFFPFNLVGGDAVGYKDGKLVGIEFETRPSRYLEHKHAEPEVKFLICNMDDGTARHLFPPDLTILTKADLEKIIQERGGREVEVNYEAKKLIEVKIAERLKALYGFKAVKVELP